MKNLILFFRSILKNGVWFFTGTAIAVLFQWIPLLKENWFDKNKSILAIIFLSLGFLGSVFKSRLEIKNKNEELEKILYEKYNLPKDQEQILNSIYTNGEDLQEIINQDMYIGGIEGHKESLITDLKEDGYIKVSRANGSIRELECTIKGKKYIEKRL